ncbi:hypothetical protein FRC12_021424 [Ceratobasidium sp. 428]|nr:hypothetical protein FRC12_021424 [Ceratobasidium sp. 428]
MWCVTHPYSAEEPKSQEDQYYQGIWWGSERIWLDDLVRLRPSREDLELEGVEGLLPASSPDALTRALLLRITYIADAEDPRETGISVGGVIYELALESEESKPKLEESKPKPESTLGPSSMFGAPTGLLGGPATPKPEVADPSRSQLPFLNNSDPGRDSFAQDQRSRALAPASLGSGLGSSAAPPPVAEAAIGMPEPPPGYVFRRLLNPGCELVLDIGTLAGRYYPSILSMEAVDIAMRAVNEQDNQAKRRKTMGNDRKSVRKAGTVDAYAGSRSARRVGDSGEEVYEGAGRELINLLSLAGLFSGDGNTMEPEQWAKGRLSTITGAEFNGRKVLYEQWSGIEKGASSDVEMLDG